MTALVPLDRGGMENFVIHTPFKRACSACGQPATCLCDYRVGGHGLPCDLLVCDGCKSTSEEGADHCPSHARVWKARRDAHAIAHERAA